MTVQHDNVIKLIAEVKRIAVHQGGDLVDHEGKPNLLARHICRTTLMGAKTESNVLNYGNVNVRGSFELQHDAMGSNYDSVGALQQRVGYDGSGSGGWGSLPHCQSISGATQSFVKRMIERGLVPQKRGALRMGRVCQAIQISAYPTRYAFNYIWAGRQLERHWDHVKPAVHPA